MADSPAFSEADQAVQRAYEAMRRGDLETARTLCRQVLDSQAGHPGALLALGSVEMQDRRQDEAIAAFERVVGIGPNAEAYANLATCHYYQGRLEPALEAARAALAIEPAHASTLLVLAAVLHGLGRHEEALRAALEAARLDPANDVACARAGSILEHMGRLPEAEAQFRKAERLGAPSKPYSLVSFERGLLQRVMALRKDIVAAPVHRFGPRAPAGHRIVVVACCDARYFAKYGFNFVNSFAHNAAGDSLLHVHVVDPDAELDVILGRLARKTPPADVLVTTEVSPFAGKPINLAAHTYYSCSRFLHLPGFLARYRKPIVCIDIDAIVEGSFQELVAATARSDVGLTRREPLHSPWLDIVADLVVANATAGAARYFELVRDYILYFIGRGELKWHLDQAALYCVLRLLEHHGAAASAPLPARLLRRILPALPPPLPAPPRVKWLSPSAAGPVWQIRHSNDARLADARFTRYSFGEEVADR